MLIADTSGKGEYINGTRLVYPMDDKAMRFLNFLANRSYFGEFDPFGDFDIIFGATKLNLKVIEVPVRYASREYGETQISRFRHGWLLLKMVVFAYKKLKIVQLMDKNIEK